MSFDLRRATAGQSNNQSAPVQHQSRCTTNPHRGTHQAMQQHQQHQQQQQQHQQQQQYQQVLSVHPTTESTNGDSKALCEDELTAIEKIRVSCPHCHGVFNLIDGLLLDDPADDQQAEQQAQQAEQQVEQQAAHSPATRSSKSSGSPTEASPITMATVVQPGITEFGLREEPAPAQVCHTFQIVNQTIEQLERLICDPCDRRIRKISNISNCDIEIRSELPSRKFSAARNFCILRAISPGRVGKCRGLLSQQMGWVLLPKL